MKQSILNQFNLEGKVAVITGGAGLLGKKHASAIKECGGIAVSLDIVDKSLPEYIYCDITDEKQVIEAKNLIIRKYGRIDILINNAAVDPKVGTDNVKNLARFETFSLSRWNHELSVGLTGAMLCSRIFGLEMVRNGKGVILNISSDLGIIAPNQSLYRKPGLPEEQQSVKPVTYSVLKHGLIGLTKYIASYWADKGVRCNTLCPGGVYTNQSADFLQKISELIPLGRMADIDEYKAAVIFLVSDASSYMTGANLIVDGGRTCW